jgi:hypothetical protein
MGHVDDVSMLFYDQCWLSRDSFCAVFRRSERMGRFGVFLGRTVA